MKTRAKTLKSQSLRLNSGHTGKCRVPHLILMSDDVRLADPTDAMARLPRGAAVIVRTHDPQKTGPLAKRLIAMARRKGVRVLAATDVGVALRAGLDGVHLSERVARRGPPRIRTSKPGFYLSASAHNRMALWRAKKAGADFVLLSPVFATRSHPEKQPMGVWRFQLLCRQAPLSVIALGGIDDRNVRRLKGPGVVGIAAIGALA